MKLIIYKFFSFLIYCYSLAILQVMVVGANDVKTIYDKYDKNFNFFNYFDEFNTIIIRNLQSNSNSNDSTCKVINCGTLTCNVNSICNTQFNNCTCPYGYSTNNSTNNSNPIQYCCYKQKSQLTAFLLEFFLSFGIGHFYSGNYAIGSVKMFLMLFTCLCCISLVFILGCKKSIGNGQYTEKILWFASCIICFCLYFIWQIIDIVLYSLNILKDENNVELANWNESG